MTSHETQVLKFTNKHFFKKASIKLSRLQEGELDLKTHSNLQSGTSYIIQFIKYSQQHYEVDIKLYLILTEVQRG